MSGPTGRFAPSPSGRLHLGNLACSLLAWLSAKSRGGRVVLRIEDLDAARCPRVYAGQLEEDLLWLRASASMPLVSRIVEIGGVPYLDGGVADSIPLDYMEAVRGHRRNVVVLTQPEGFVKQPNSMLPLMKLRYGRRYPAFVASLADRHNAYNARLEEIRAREREGLCFVIRPPQALEIKAVVHDPDELERVYQIGRRTGESTFEALTTFLRSQPLL